MGFQNRIRGREGEREAPPARLAEQAGQGRDISKSPRRSVGRSVASVLLTVIPPHGKTRNIPTPRGVGIPPRYFDSTSGHAPALGCRDGSGTCRRIISGVLRVPSFPIFWSSASGLIFRLRPRVPRLPRAGRMTQPQALGIVPACESRRRHPRQEHTRGNHARARSVRRILPLRDFSAYAIPYHQGVIRTPRRACPRVAFYFR